MLGESVRWAEDRPASEAAGECSACEGEGALVLFCSDGEVCEPVADRFLVVWRSVAVVGDF